MNTKTLKIFLSAASILGCLTACDDYLEKTPNLSLSSEDIFNSQERIEGVILGAYSKMKTGSGNKLLICIENIGDDFINVSGNVQNEALESYELGIGLNSGDNTTVWSNTYQIINNVNTALDNLEANPEGAGDKLEAFRQELRFQRALNYFYLNFFYAKPYVVDAQALSVPLRLKGESSLVNEDLAQATNAEVYAQILEDTRDYSALPSTGSTYDNITRASQAAVLTLRQRVFLALGQWEQVVEAGRAIHGYSLTDTPAGPFQSSASCPEVIFTYPQTSTDFGGGHQQSLPYFFGTGQSLALDRSSGILSDLYPAYNLPADKRIAELTTYKNAQPIVTKYTDDVNYLDWVVVFRYAEVKLNLAEAYAHLGREDEARQELSDVRRRSLSAAVDPLDISTLTGDDLLQAIYQERRIEFLGESLRAIDIKRRGESITKQKGTPSEWTVTPQQDGYTWPIPATERTNNRLIGST